MAALASFKVSWLFPVEERELLIFKIIVLLYLCVKNKEALALLEDGKNRAVIIAARKQRTPII